MDIVSRTNLLAFLTGPFMDPDQQAQEELNAIANAVLADAPATITHFLHTDHENGDDPVVAYPEHVETQNRGLITEKYNSRGDSYYGVMAQSRSDSYPGDDRVLYHCYLGGSPLNSAPGFVLTALAAE